MKSAFLFAGLMMLCGVVLAKVKTDKVEYKQGDTVLQGYLSYDPDVQGKRIGILVVPDWMGVSDKARMRGEMLASMGYVALVADVYGKDVRPKDGKEASAEAGKFYADRALFRSRVRAGLEYLSSQAQTDPQNLGVVGYCFGGAGARELARSGAPVKAIVTFHGGLATPHPEDAKNIKGRVLVLHGADDPFVKQTDVTAFMDEMRKGGVDWQLVQYGGAVHSFTDKTAGDDNSKGQAYNENADRRSWKAMTDFLTEVFGK